MFFVYFYYWPNKNRVWIAILYISLIEKKTMPLAKLLFPQYDEFFTQVFSVRNWFCEDKKKKIDFLRKDYFSGRFEGKKRVISEWLSVNPYFDNNLTF